MVLIYFILVSPLTLEYPEGKEIWFSSIYTFLSIAWMYSMSYLTVNCKWLTEGHDD